jgi:hypothetical protein
MKTLIKNKPIQGDLLLLYKYYFSPGGTAQEALDIAEANHMRNKLEVLIANQLYWADTIIQELRQNTKNAKISPEGREIPSTFSAVEDPMNVISRHALTGEYKIVAEFEMLVVHETPDKPAYFCNQVDFHLLAIYGAAHGVPVDKVPQYLINKAFHDTCYRCAKGLDDGLCVAMRKADNYMGGVEESQKAAHGISITHNLPNFPTIDIYSHIRKNYMHKHE